MACGFSNGVVRIMILEEDKVNLVTSFKAHDVPVKMIKYSSRARHCISSG